MLEDATRREQRDLRLLRRYREDGDLFARDELARRCTPLVRSIARRYAQSGEHPADVVQAGMLGLTKAIERYDMDAGHRFVSYAVPNITGEIRRHFRDCTWAVHVPRSVQELDSRVHAARQEAHAAGRPEPDDHELAKVLDEPLPRIREAIAAGQSYRALSYDAPAGEERAFLDLMGRPDAELDRIEGRATIAEAMSVLDERERQIIDWRYHDGLLQREIAEKVGLSQMQISRLLSESIDRMAEHVAAQEVAAA